MDIFVVLQTMIKLFLLLILGFVLFKCGIFDEHTNKKISALIVNVTSPLLVIYSVTTVESKNMALVFELVGAGIAIYIGYIIFAKIISRFLPVPKKDRAIYELMMVFANTGFMGYPVLLSLFNQDSVFYCSMLHMAFNLFIYTYGVMTLSQKEGEKFHFDPKVLVTPGLILTFVAILLFIIKIPIPSLLVDTCQSVGNLTSPLSMMMIGASLATYPVLECISDWRSYVFAVIRLLVIPFIVMLGCKLIGVDSYFANIAIITAGMPVGSMVLMLATQYNSNTKVATKNIIVSTTLSIITIPILVGFMLI